MLGLKRKWRGHFVEVHGKCLSSQITHQSVCIKICYGSNSICTLGLMGDENWSSGCEWEMRGRMETDCWELRQRQQVADALNGSPICQSGAAHKLANRAQRLQDEAAFVEWVTFWWMVPQQCGQHFLWPFAFCWDSWESEISTCP